MTFIHQDVNNKLFCDNIIKCFDDCFRIFFEDCDKKVKFDKNDLIKNLIKRYPICQNTVKDELEYRFPSEPNDGILNFKLNLYLFYFSLILLSSNLKFKF